MTRETVRVRLKSGNSEIEVDGDRAEVDALLERWWTPLISGGGQPDGDVPPEHGEDNVQLQRPRRRKTTTATKPPTPSESDGINTQNIVNDLKESEQFERLEGKVFHKPDRYNKVAAILWFASSALSTSEIVAVLQGIGVKIDAPGVSNTIAANTSKFVNDQPRKGGRKTRYSLTSKARKEFEDWLKNDA
jgi:hypothetical protein